MSTLAGLSGSRSSTHVPPASTYGTLAGTVTRCSPAGSISGGVRSTTSTILTVVEDALLVLSMQRRWISYLPSLSTSRLDLMTLGAKSGSLGSLHIVVSSYGANRVCVTDVCLPPGCIVGGSWSAEPPPVRRTLLSATAKFSWLSSHL